MRQIFCDHLPICGGCSWGMRPLSEQRVAKLLEVQPLFAQTAFRATHDLGLRDRVDLIWLDGKLGLYTTAESPGPRQVVDIGACPMLSAPLEEFLRCYRFRSPPGVHKGSVRLRTSPAGERGVWLDFANQDVKALFDEQNYLRWLNEFAFVEIGQRRKTLAWQSGRPRLTEPTLKPWFETYDQNLNPIPLYGPVGGFSQVGFAVNRVLIETVSAAAVRTGLCQWTELFCGNGNFAISLAARGLEVDALELEPLAIEGLRRSVENHPEWRVHPRQMDVYLKAGQLKLAQGLLVDPPRAGLRQVLKLIEDQIERPRAIIYVSCFAASLTSDAAALTALGYRLTSLEGVDQFAHSPHAEWVALFER